MDASPVVPGPSGQAVAWTSRNLPWKHVGKGWFRATIELAKGDTAWNPASTKRVIYGPCTVQYERGPSGGIDAVVS
jgi:hypothetical protein